MATKKSISAQHQAGGANAKSIRNITSEEDAVRLLLELRNIPGPLPFQIRFKGWPIWTANLKGEQFNSTITTGVMHGFLALQKELNRSYTVVKFGQQRQPKLSREERESLELEIKVNRGSSDLVTINTPQIFDAISTTLTNMNSADTATVLIVAALAYFGSASVKAWLNNRKDVRLKEIEKDEHSAAREVTITMSREETRRLEAIASIIKGKPELEDVARNAATAHDEILKSVRSADSVELQGVQVSGEFVREVTATERRDFYLKTYKKRCRILKVDTSNEAQYKVTIRFLDTGQELTCPLEDETLDARYKEKILAALSTRAKVTLHIEAKAHDDLLRDVKILGIVG